MGGPYGAQIPINLVSTCVSNGPFIVFVIDVVVVIVISPADA